MAQNDNLVKIGLANIFRNIFVFVFLIAVFAPGFFSLRNIFPSEYNLKDVSDEYHYQNYSVDATVLKDNSLIVSEEMTAYFSVVSRGIIRAFPTIQTVSFLDEEGKEKKMNYKVDITEIKTSSTTTKIYETFE